MGRTVSRADGDGPLHVWEVERLWELARDLPVKRVPLDPLLDMVGWYGTEETRGYLTVREVVEHARQIDAVSLEYPVLLAADGQIFDGLHRVAKAHLLGHDDIAAVQFDANPEPDRVVPLPGWAESG